MLWLHSPRLRWIAAWCSQKETAVEAAHQSERLRAAVLDSLAHAVKTPLTAIQAATAGLSEVGKLNRAQEELLALVEDEANRLSLLSTRLLQTAKLEAEEMSVAKDEIAVRDLVETVLAGSDEGACRAIP